jgi:hypothetical protein
MVPAAPTLRDYVESSAAERFLWDRAASIRVTHLRHGTALGGRRSALAGRSVIIATSSQLAAALALIELDGVARRLTILPPDTSAEHIGELVARAEADAVVVDEATPANSAFDLLQRVVCAPAMALADEVALPRMQTEWLSAHLRHIRCAETRCPYPRKSRCSDCCCQAIGRNARVGDFLRHPPVWRLADILACNGRRDVACSIERR